MTESVPIPDKKRLTCPICNATFFNIFPAGKCQACSQLICGHCIHHDNPDHPGSTCQDCIAKKTPHGRVAQMDSDELLAVLKDPSSNDSSLVARLLGDRGDDTSLEPLFLALKTDRVDVRREATFALGKIGSDQAVPALLNALNDAAPAVRGRAAWSLAELGAKEALPLIKKQLDDSSQQAAGYAVQALEKLMGHSACGLLNDLVQDHTSDFIRCEALAVLARLDHEPALAAALKCLDYPKKSVIICACKILIRLNDLEAAPKLEKLIEKTPSPRIRIMAQMTLNKLLDIKD